MGIETAVIVGAALSATSAIATGEQAQAAGKYQQAQAEADAQAAQGEATVQASKLREAARRQRSEATAALAASGVNVGVGTAEQIQTDITRRGEEDALTAILNGTSTAKSTRARGEAAAIAGDNALTAGYISAAGSALSAYGSYSKWKTPTGFSGTQAPAPVQRIS